MLVVLPCKYRGKDTNKRGQKQACLQFAEREYLGRSQRYEKSSAEANAVCILPSYQRGGCDVADVGGPQLRRAKARMLRSSASCAPSYVHTGVVAAESTSRGGRQPAAAPSAEGCFSPPLGASSTRAARRPLPRHPEAKSLPPATQPPSPERHTQRAPLDEGCPLYLRVPDS